MRFEQKVVMVTGGAAGIGLATVQQFAKEGAQVIVCDMNQEAIDVAVLTCQGLSGKAVGMMMDVTDTTQIAAVRDQVMRQFGRLDVLVNNAGIVMDAQLSKMTEDQFDRVIDVNLKGTYNVTRAWIDVFLAQNSGVILNASSVVGVYGNFGQTNYAASKFGVIGMTKTWAKELGRKGIRSNAVCPGFVETSILKDMPEEVMAKMAAAVPMKRLAQPEEIAKVYAFLASDDASYINGAALEVTGGLTI